MTEQEFTLVSDLRAINHAKEALRDIVPENSPWLEKAEWLTMQQTIQRWQYLLYIEVGKAVK